MGYFSEVVFNLSSLCLVGILVACAQPGTTTQPAEVTDELDGTEWVLESLGAQPLVEDTNITLEFGDGSYSGYSGCNFYGGDYTADEEGLKFFSGPTTAQDCGGPVMDQENVFWGAFGYDKSVAYSLSNSRLTLAGDNGTTLVFIEQPQLPMNPADLIGTVWQLSGLNGEVFVSSELVTLEFPAAGTFRGLLGCIDYSGTYTAQGDDIWFGEYGHAYTRCQDGDEQEGVEVEVSVSGATDYRLEEGELELLTYYGDTLLFTAQP